jgi:hypothetical protein
MIDTNHWGYRQILHEAIQYRVLRRMIEASRAAVGRSDEPPPSAGGLYEQITAH